ncbi:hypothetical protein [Erythrobacter aureus]|uniref:Uncharacterized protein n=1 Tax=Erythrobacter aureus TaxID=2182384 RepID=A0A345YJ30_9SPHN|nr:hypothetical protein [Erythrobacter aureus]AXK43932.1 hypothetical protein DVR09_15875 [Erythrobacter aureus]
MTLSSETIATLTSEVDRIIAWASTLGVSICIDIDACAGLLHVPSLFRETSDPSTKGNGKTVLDAVIALAENHRLTIEIEHMTDEPRLGEYYRSFGFIPYGDIGFITNLHRPPAGQDLPQALAA